MYIYCSNNPVLFMDPSGTYSVSVPILSKGLNLPAGKGTPVMIGGEAYYYYSVVQRGGYTYEYWYDATGNLVHARHNTDHGQPKYHEDPHDHKGGKDKNGHNTIEKKPLKKDDHFIPPKELGQAMPSNGENVADIVAGASAAYIIYQVIKWVGATLLAPETGGFSYVGAGALP